MTYAEALASCIARGIHEPECRATLDAQLDGAGVYCDGTLVLDGSFPEGDPRRRRCVPRAVSDAVNAARAAAPLPASVRAGAPILQTPPIPPVVLAAGAVALGVLGIVLVSRILRSA